MGVGADQFFQTKDGAQKFLLSWSIPPLNCKPKVRVTFEQNIKVEASFENKNLVVRIATEEEELPPIIVPKIHRKMSEDNKIDDSLKLEKHDTTISKVTVLQKSEIHSNTTDADSEDLVRSTILVNTSRCNEYSISQRKADSLSDIGD
eukprot:CAMPEP_0196995516 /NCGR_PEP_ID=MMETSP1380-20130617/1605_1 /TAXON_ID=5936 /ORGANISM="Euplotes crassus, Strain CT5" /LENGTH=147 /DNA_ID=CAMNT_0042411189 /DNA_START=170 /DNA_END=613 /DNA_ORIENTATION=-